MTGMRRRVHIPADTPVRVVAGDYAGLEGCTVDDTHTSTERVGVYGVTTAGRFLVYPLASDIRVAELEDDDA